jgi:aquaporin Z
MPEKNLRIKYRMRVSFTSYFAEYVGAFFFILSIFASGGNPLVIGSALALVIFLIAGISGGHVNPAVSLAMYMNGALKPMEFVGYAVSQLLGGASAYYAYKML